MKNNGLWKQQWKLGVSASSVKAAAQQHTLPSDGELDAKVTSRYHSATSLFIRTANNNLWHLKD